MEHRAAVRWVVGGVGAVLLGIAIWWSWSSRPEAVVLATLGIGAVLVYLAYSGQLLIGLKAGNVEATFVDVVKAIDEDPDTPREVKAKIADIVRQGEAPIAVRQRARSFSAAHRGALYFEDGVKNELQQLSTAKGWELETLASGGPFDFKIINGPQTVRVECRWASEPPLQDLFNKWKATAEHQGGTTLGAGIVLVVSDLPSNTPAETGVVLWKNPTHTDDLRDQIESAFSPLIP